VVTAINPAFLTLQNFFDLLHNSSGTAILAIGFFIALLSGGIDISFPAVAIIGQYVAVNALIGLHVSNLGLAFLFSCGIGIAFGAVNAFFVSVLRINTLIVTLGTSSLFHGAMLELLGTKAVNAGQLPACFTNFGYFKVIHLQTASGTPYGLPIFAVVLTAVVLVTWIILRYTLLGRIIYAMGGNFEAVRRSGVNIRRVHFFIYCYVGFLAGIMGIMAVSLIRYSNPTYIVDTELLPVIAAVVLGGASIMGGSGTLTGTLLGVALIGILQQNLVLIGLSSYWQQFFVGLMLVVGVTVTHVQRRIQSRRQLTFMRDS
jgi:simple sugar transport system permease protein